MSDLTTRIADAIWSGLANDENDMMGGNYVSRVGGVIDGHDFDMAAIAAAVVAEIHPTITSVEDLAELPAGTVIRDRDGEVFVYEDELARGWFYPGDDDPLPHSMIALPAILLWKPEVGA